MSADFHDVFVIFGANGDLTSRKLIPALYKLYSHNYLNQKFSIIGISRTEYSDETFRDKLKKRLSKEMNIDTNTENFDKFLENLFYIPLNVKNSEDFTLLSDKISDLAGAQHLANCYFYLATAPQLYEDIVNNISSRGLISLPEDPNKTCLIVEKPIGQDLKSAQNLSQILRQHFQESQIYRIDHYLGKETVQNILLFRFTNAIFEAIWNNKFIDHIQVAVCESVGVELRADYYDQTGALRDMVQNHILQIISLLCIEPPGSLNDSDSIHNEKVKVLKSIKRFSVEDLDRNIARAQYSGFSELEGVVENSKTETYVAAKLEIDNWRWSGVPIFIRTGKRLKKKISEITIFFKNAPDAVLNSLTIDQLKPNVLAIQIQPGENISVQFNTKPPGLDTNVKPVIMDFTYHESFSSSIFDAYERLLLDLLKGDQTLFIRDDEVIESWKLLDPILDCWDSSMDCSNLYHYPASSWGPEEASLLMDGTDRCWRNFE